MEPKGNKKLPGEGTRLNPWRGFDSVRLKRLEQGDVLNVLPGDYSSTLYIPPTANGVTVRCGGSIVHNGFGIAKGINCYGKNILFDVNEWHMNGFRSSAIYLDRLSHNASLANFVTSQSSKGVYISGRNHKICSSTVLDGIYVSGASQVEINSCRLQSPTEDGAITVRSNRKSRYILIKNTLFESSDSHVMFDSPTSNVLIESCMFDDAKKCSILSNATTNNLKISSSAIRGPETELHHIKVGAMSSKWALKEVYIDGPADIDFTMAKEAPETSLCIRGLSVPNGSKAGRWAKRPVNFESLEFLPSW